MLFHGETRACLIEKASLEKDKKTNAPVVKLRLSLELTREDLDALELDPDGVASWGTKVKGAYGLGRYDLEVNLGGVSMPAKFSDLDKPELEIVAPPVKKTETSQLQIPGTEFDIVEEPRPAIVRLLFWARFVRPQEYPLEFYAELHGRMGQYANVAFEAHSVLEERLQEVAELHCLRDLWNLKGTRWPAVWDRILRATFEARGLGESPVPPLYRHLGFRRGMGDCRPDWLLDQFIAMAQTGDDEGLLAAVRKHAIGETGAAPH